MLWRWCAVSLGEEALRGQPLPSLDLSWVGLNTRRTLLLPSPTSSSRARSTRQTHGQPPVLVSLGLSPSGGHSGTIELPVVETLGSEGSERSTLLSGCAQILRGTAVTARAPLAGYRIPQPLAEPHSSTT